MRKILASVILVMMLCASAYASVVYTTDSGNIGYIKVDSSSNVSNYGIQYSGGVKDSFLGSYWDGSNSRIILVSRTTDTTTSGDTALIFDPASLATPIDSERKVLDGVYNTQAITGSYNGRGLFFGSGASIHEFNTESFAPARSYKYKMTSSDKTAPAVRSILTGTYTVYVLFDREDSGDCVFVFDGQLRDDIEGFEKHEFYGDASCLVWVHGSIALAHSEGVDFLSSGKFVRSVSSDVPVKALCEDGGSGYYFAEQSVSGDKYTTTLKHYASKSTKTILTDTSGSACKLMRDEDNNLLAAIIGNKICIYNMNGDSLVAEFNSSELGGLPVNIAMSYVKGDDGSTKSGCEVAGTGIIMLLAGALILMKRQATLTVSDS